MVGSHLAASNGGWVDWFGWVEGRALAPQQSPDLDLADSLKLPCVDGRNSDDSDSRNLQ